VLALALSAVCVLSAVTIGLALGLARYSRMAERKIKR
jgi:hypothetical protein